MRAIDLVGKAVAGFRLGAFLPSVGEARSVKNDVDINQTQVHWNQKPLTGQSLFVIVDILILQKWQRYIHCAAILFRNCLCFCVLCNSNRSTANLSRSFFWTSLLSSAALDAAALPDEAAPDPAKRPRNELP